MKITFPESLDTLNLRPDRRTRNSAETANAIRTDDLLYIIDELERKVGADHSADPSSLDYRLAALEEIVAVQTATMELLRRMIAALSAGATAGTCRAKISDVTLGGTEIYFPSPITTEYIILGNCYNTDGELNGYVITEQSPDGFTILPDADGTFEWAAVKTS